MFSNKALKKLIIPLFLNQIRIITVSIIGTMMVSYAGEAAVSGVSLVDMINMLLINVLAALATGGAVVVSQYIGRKEKEQASLAASQLVTITTVISTGIMLFVLIFNKLALRILFGSVDEDVMTAAIIYFVISGLSYPFLAIYNSCAALFRSMGNSRIPMILNLYTLSSEVRHLTYIRVVIHNCFAIFLWPISFTLPNGLRAAGDVRFTMIVSIGSMFILRIALGYIMAIVFKMGVIGIWVAMGFDWMLRSVIYIIRFKGGRWKKFQVI